MPQFLFRFSIREQVFFSKRLSFLLTAGIPLLESLHIIRDQAKSARKKLLFSKIIDDVSNGHFLSSSLRRQQTVFSEFAVNILEVGESSGSLSQNLSYLSQELEKMHALRRKILSALVYPAFITLTTLALAIFLMEFIFPKLLPIFTSLHTTLPLITRIFIAMSSFLQVWGFATCLVIVAVVGAFLCARAYVPRVRTFFDSVFLRVPVMGGLAKRYILGQCFRTCGLLLQSGVPVEEAFAIAAHVTANTLYKNALAEAAQRILRGERIAKSLERYPNLFPDICAHLIAIGEKTGTLSHTCMYLSQLYEEEVDERTKNLSNSVEPILMLVMGLLVGLIAISVMTPIYAITQHLQTH
jgi:type IV pilus assembly protein PilC